MTASASCWDRMPLLRSACRTSSSLTRSSLSAPKKDLASVQKHSGFCLDQPAEQLEANGQPGDGILQNIRSPSAAMPSARARSLEVRMLARVEPIATVTDSRSNAFIFDSVRLPDTAGEE